MFSPVRASETWYDPDCKKLQQQSTECEPWRSKRALEFSNSKRSSTMHAVIESLRREIQIHDKPENKINIQRFFKETLDNPYSLRGAVFKKISQKCFKEVQPLKKNEILDICDEILETDLMHRIGFAFDWARKLENDLEPTDFQRLERWLRDYVANWGSCDVLCCGALGTLIRNYPELAAKRASWTASENRWLRRAAAVSLIVAVKEKLLLPEVFETADRLLQDSDDLVQKGYGWMLKDASLRFPSEVFDYVLKNRRTMPRTALRYAIERYSKEERKEAMKRV